MPPPNLPLGSPDLNILPSNQNAVSQASHPASPGIGPAALSSANIPSTGATPGDNTGVGAGPGPLRHPRPLTAADLHLQLEKEQEAVVRYPPSLVDNNGLRSKKVNRLTRELSLLRAAQNASVASNTSSTSAGHADTAEHSLSASASSSNHLFSNPPFPTPSHRERERMHHRSSSSTSARSITTPGSLSTVGGIAGSSASAVAPERTRPQPYNRQDSNTVGSGLFLSRQNSTTGSRRSGASSPAGVSSAHSSWQHEAGSHHRDRFPAREREPGGERGHAAGDGNVVTSARYEEAAFHRQELDSVRRENEALKRRIRDLERMVRAGRERRGIEGVATGRDRSESVSTTASAAVGSVRDSMGSGVGRGRERDREGEEEVVRVGESARSGGLR